MKIDPDHMAAAAEQASELLRSLGNRHRLLILCQLTEGERSVGDLAAFLGLRDSTVSQHLSLLRRDGLGACATRRPDHLVFHRQSTSTARAGNAVRDLLQARLHVRAACAPAKAEGASPRSKQEAAMNLNRILRCAATLRIDPDQCVLRLHRRFFLNRS